MTEYPDRERAQAGGGDEGDGGLGALGGALEAFAHGEEARTPEDEDTVLAVLDQFQAAEKKRSWALPAVVATLAAAASVALWFGGTPDGADSPEPAAPVVARAPADTGEANARLTETPPPSALAFRVQSGAFTAAGATLAAGDAIAVASTLRSEAASCVGYGEASLCTEGPTELLVGGEHVSLEHGKLHLQIPEGLAAPTIATARGVVTPGAGEHTVSMVGPVMIVAVIAGAASVEEPDATVHELVAPQSLTLNEHGAKTAVPEDTGGDAEPDIAVASPSELLERAQSERSAGQGRNAAKTYRLLVRHHPQSKEARNALVSLGQLELDLGRPKSALSAFERYLKSGGILAEDAAYGKIRALQQLGRGARERAAIEAFVRAHPDSPYRETLERRLEKKND